MIKLIYFLSLLFVSISLNAQVSILNREYAFEAKDTLPKYPKDPNIYVSAEVMPQFPGGDAELMKYIGANMKYPTVSLKDGVDGRIVVRFVIRKTGEIDNIEFLRPLAKPVETEVIRLIKNMPQWTPGKMNGENVDCYYTLSTFICFRSK